MPVVMGALQAGDSIVSLYLTNARNLSQDLPPNIAFEAVNLCDKENNLLAVFQQKDSALWQCICALTPNSYYRLRFKWKDKLIGIETYMPADFIAYINVKDSMDNNTLYAQLQIQNTDSMYGYYIIECWHHYQNKKERILIRNTDGFIDNNLYLEIDSPYSSLFLKAEQVQYLLQLELIKPAAFAVQDSIEICIKRVDANYYRYLYQSAVQASNPNYYLPMHQSAYLGVWGAVNSKKIWIPPQMR